jgi:hypothetical protein
MTNTGNVKRRRVSFIRLTGVFDKEHEWFYPNLFSISGKINNQIVGDAKRKQESTNHGKCTSSVPSEKKVD